MGRATRLASSSAPPKQKEALRRFFDFFVSVSLYYHALIPCFFAQIGSLLGFLRQNQNFRVLIFLQGERKPKYPDPDFVYNQESGARLEPIYFLFFSLCP